MSIKSDRSLAKKRSDSISLFPFLRHRGDLRITFKLDAHDQVIDAGRTIAYKPEFSTFGIKPTVEMQLDPLTIAKELGEKPPSLGMAVILRDRLIKRHSVLASWPLDDAPRNWTADNPIKISARSDLAVAFYLRANRAHDGGKAYRAGSTLASASISIMPDNDSSQFQMLDKPPSAFLELGMPEDTIWTVRLKDQADVEQPANEVVEIWINTKHKAQLISAQQRPDSKAFVSALAASIYAAAIRVVIASAHHAPQQPDGTLMSMCDKISKATDKTMDFRDIQIAVKGGDHHKIDAIAQVVAEMHKRLG